MGILLGTIYGVFRGQDMGELKEALAGCRADWIVWAAGCVVLFILCDSTNLWLLLDSFGMGMRHRTCFLTSCVGFFFCAITPSATGGQPMQVYLLRKKGLPVSVSSMAFLAMALCYKLVLVLAGLGMLVFGGGFLREHLGGMMFLYHIGLLLTGGWTVFLLLLMFRPGLARGILVWGMTVLEELHILKNREKYQTALEVAMDLYADAADHLKTNRWLLLKIFLLSAARRAALFSVTWCVYRALGLSGDSWFTVVLLQAVIALCADMLPLPGGMGISEALFLKAFGTVFGSLALPGMLLSRGIGHYCQLILCALFTLLALFLSDRDSPDTIK